MPERRWVTVTNLNDDEFMIDPTAVFALEPYELESLPGEPCTVIHVGNITVLVPGTTAETVALLDASTRGVCSFCDRYDVPVVDGCLAVHAGAGLARCPGSGKVIYDHEPSA